jgi:uncharacterized membrane protein
VPNFIMAILGALCALLVVAVLLGLPIFALIQFSQLKTRLQKLERDVSKLRRNVAATEIVADAEPIPVVLPVPAPAEHGERKTRHKPRPVDTGGPDWTKLEAWLGVRALGWAAVVLLLITAAFFLKLVFERGLIGELGRIMVGVSVGTALCIGGWVCHRRGQSVYCQMLTSAGIALLYLSTYATFGFYQLVPQDRAAPFLILLIAEAFALAALYQSPAIAVMAVIGGLLNPILLHSERDQYVGLFSYLAILNAGVVTLALFRRWWVVTTLALVGTHGLFWLWFFERYHPGKLNACLAFHLAIFGLYLGQMAVVNVWQKRAANVEDLIRLLLRAVLTSSADYVLLDERFHFWMGTFAIGLAIVYALLAGLVNRVRAEDGRLLFVLIALAMAFVAAVFPLQADVAWIAVGWVVQGLALWWFGLRVRNTLLYGLGAAFLALALGRLFFVDTFATQPHDGPFMPIFNRYGCPATIVALSLIVAALLQRRTHPEPITPDFLVMRLVGLAGVVTLWIVLSIETYDFFVVRGNLASPGVQASLTPEERELPQGVLQQRFAERAEHLRLTAQMSLSALWAVFALAQLAVGLRLQHRPLRWLGLGLFALTLAKVMIVDTETLRGMYRVGALFALSLMMAAGAWAYQKLRHALLDTELEKDHEPEP